MFFLQKRIDVIIIFLLYLTLLGGFFLNEDLNGGAKGDYEGYKIIIQNFNENFKYTF